MEDFLVDLDDWGFLLLGGFGSRPGMALLSEVRLRIKTLTDWRAICIFTKCERFFTLPSGAFPRDRQRGVMMIFSV